MYKNLLGWILALGFSTVAFGQSTNDAAQGMVSITSQHSVADTVAKLNKALKAKGMTIFTTIDHAAGANKVGIDLPQSQLVVFGNPKIGSPLMLCKPSIAIDLPQKMLIWQNPEGTVMLAYNDPLYLAQRHQIAQDDPCYPILNKVSNALANFANAASS